MSSLATRPLTIGYFGASVTAQKEGYRPRLHERLRAGSGEDLRSLFAGVGGVDVVSAAFLADDLIVRHRPDLCLVEFSSTELIWGSSLVDAESAMDGILAKLNEAGIRPCLLHLPRREWRDEHADMLAAFERVAGLQGVPSIDLTAELLERARKPDADPVFRDEVHLTAAGAELAAEMTEAALAPIIATVGRAEPGETPPAPGAERYREARVLPVAPDDARGPAEMGLFRMQRAFLAVPDGSAIRRRFADRLAGLLLVVGPQSGELEVTDRAGRQRVMTWDDYCSYDRFTTCLFERPCEAGDEIQIELTDTVPDYATCRRPLDPPEGRVAKVMGYMVLPA